MNTTGRQEWVVVVDDDAASLRATARLLRHAGFRVRCHDGPDAFVREGWPGGEGCAVLDLEMPGMDGLGLQHWLSTVAGFVPVVFLTGRGDVPASVRAMRGGAEDFLMKTCEPEALLEAVERAIAASRQRRVAHERQEDLRRQFAVLTSREHDVLRHVLAGDLNKVTAAELGIDERSVKRHRTSLMRKLGVVSVAELARRAMEAGHASSGVAATADAIDAHPSGGRIGE
jgi:FixJ family two-component response regulator